MNPLNRLVFKLKHRKELKKRIRDCGTLSTGSIG